MALPQSRSTCLTSLQDEMQHGLCFEGSCNLWEIYDEYIHDFDRHRVEELSKAKAVAGKKASNVASLRKEEAAPDIMQSNALIKALRIVDRTVNQNMYDEITMDYKYWEDTTDAFRFD